MALQWRSKFWQSLEEGAGKRCSEHGPIYLGPWLGVWWDRVQELCESRGDRPGLPVLTSLMVSVDVKQH